MEYIHINIGQTGKGCFSHWPTTTTKQRAKIISKPNCSSSSNILTVFTWK